MNAFLAARIVFLSLLSARLNFLVNDFSFPATDIHVVPTGFSRVPPSGPAIPVIPIA